MLGLVGALDVPIVNRAVYWWRTIHPAVIQNRDGSTGLADPAMQLTFFGCMAAFFLLFLWLLWIRSENLRLQDALEDLRQRALHA